MSLTLVLIGYVLIGVAVSWWMLSEGPDDIPMGIVAGLMWGPILVLAIIFKAFDVVAWLTA